MAVGSGVDVVIEASKVPIIKEARDLAGTDVVPGGTVNNLEYVEPHVTFADSIPKSMKFLLADAQTSGGLLISVPRSKATTLVNSLKNRGISDTAIIGEISEEGTGKITIKP
jgi:selenide,water dikinase